MRITIDTHAATPAEMGICIATLQACGADMPGGTRDVIIDTSKAGPIYRTGYAGDDSFDTRAGSLLGLAAMAHTDEIVKLIGLLNDELYSRRIPTADNPESGADAAALNSDASGFTKEELTAKFNNEVVKPLLAPMVEVVEKLDLANVFGGAGGGAKNTAIVVHAEQGDTTGEPLPNITSTVSGVTLDKAGIPWDSRIHSASKSINQTDGLWRQKRGVSPELVATVVGQLKQAQSVPGVPGVGTHGSSDLDADAAKLTAMGGDAGPTVDDVFGANQHQGQVVGTPPTGKIIPPPPPRIDVTNLHSNGQETVTGTPPPPPPTDTGEIDSLPRLLKFITEQKLAGKINQTHVQAALTALGIEGPLPVIASRPDLIPEMVKKLRAIGGIA